MTRATLLVVALLSSGCHTTVYRTESEPVRIHVTRPRPRANGAAADRPAVAEPGAATPADAGANEPAPDPGGHP